MPWGKVSWCSERILKWTYLGISHMRLDYFCQNSFVDLLLVSAYFRFGNSDLTHSDWLIPSLGLHSTTGPLHLDGMNDTKGQPLVSFQENTDRRGENMPSEVLCWVGGILPTSFFLAMPSSQSVHLPIMPPFLLLATWEWRSNKNLLSGNKLLMSKQALFDSWEQYWNINPESGNPKRFVWGSLGWGGSKDSSCCYVLYFLLTS